MRKTLSKDSERGIHMYPFLFKQTIVDDIENGLLTVNSASVRYGIQRSTINRWLSKWGNYSKKVSNMQSSPKQQIKELQSRLKQLEAEKRLWNDMLDMLSEEYGSDLKKKFSSGLITKVKC